MENNKKKKMEDHSDGGDNKILLAKMTTAHDASKEKILKLIPKYKDHCLSRLSVVSFAILKQDYVTRNEFASVDNMMEYTKFYMQFDPSEKVVDDVVQSRKKTNGKKQLTKEVIVENSPYVKYYYDTVQEDVRELNETVDSEIQHLLEEFKNNKGHKQLWKFVQSLKNIATSHSSFITKYIPLIRAPPNLESYTRHKAKDLSKRFADCDSDSGKRFLELDTWIVALEKLIKKSEVNQIVRVFSVYDMLGKLETNGFSTERTSVKECLLKNESIHAISLDINMKRLVETLKSLMNDQLQFMSQKVAKKELDQMEKRLSKLSDQISFGKNSDRYIQQCEASKYFNANPQLTVSTSSNEAAHLNFTFIRQFSQSEEEVKALVDVASIRATQILEARLKELVSQTSRDEILNACSLPVVNLFSNEAHMEKLAEYFKNVRRKVCFHVQEKQGMIILNDLADHLERSYDIYSNCEVEKSIREELVRFVDSERQKGCRMMEQLGILDNAEKKCVAFSEAFLATLDRSDVEPKIHDTDGNLESETIEDESLDLVVFRYISSIIEVIKFTTYELFKLMDLCRNFIEKKCLEKHLLNLESIVALYDTAEYMNSYKERMLEDNGLIINARQFDEFLVKNIAVPKLLSFNGGCIIDLSNNFDPLKRKNFMFSFEIKKIHDSIRKHQQDLKDAIDFGISGLTNSPQFLYTRQNINYMTEIRKNLDVFIAKNDHLLTGPILELAKGKFGDHFFSLHLFMNFVEAVIEPQKNLEYEFEQVVTCIMEAFEKCDEFDENEKKDFISGLQFFVITQCDYDTVPVENFMKKMEGFLKDIESLASKSNNVKNLECLQQHFEKLSALRLSVEKQNEEKETETLVTPPTPITEEEKNKVREFLRF